uniref:Cryptochrome circadian regulator 5 n=1 Tax=Cynoglossus semilaevis TaxID=244447 RepID=A0A3P8VUX5_CYNSE
MTHNCIHWFRKGLRLHDNPALVSALRDCKDLYPVFVLDPHLYNSDHMGINRWRFLVGCLHDLDCSLRKLKSRLFVLRGHPEDVFPELFKKWDVTKLTYEYDTEPYSLSRDGKVTELAERHGVEVVYKISHTLYDMDRVIEENNGKAPLTYNRMQAILKSLGPPKKPVPAPTLEDMNEIKTPYTENHEEEYGIPPLGELCEDTAAPGEEKFPGGEEEALRRLDEHMKRTAWVCKFEKPQTSPNSLSPSTTVLSPYVTFGCLSARTFWWRLAGGYQGNKHSSPPVSLHGQLLWREFYYAASVGIPNFNKMVGNPVCTQVDWDSNPELLAAWREARTGFPFIDAIMTQLRQEGWIHHLARHAVACFLTRGDLWINWEEGQKVFEKLLLDGDWALNAGNWLWLSASAFFHQFFRVYSPVAFGKKTDKNGDYINVQQAAGCIVGKDYPQPIVKHEEIHKKNIQRMKLAYAKRSSDAAVSPNKKQGWTTDTATGTAAPPPAATSLMSGQRPGRVQPLTLTSLNSNTALL